MTAQGKAALLELRDRLAKATGPDRALDATIENFLASGSAADLAHILQDIETTTKPPPYTASLDAAVTLVPEGWGVVLRDIPGLMPTTSIFPHFTVNGNDGSARSLPLALCLARIEYELAKEGQP